MLVSSTSTEYPYELTHLQLRIIVRDTNPRPASIHQLLNDGFYRQLVKVNSASEGLQSEYVPSNQSMDMGISFHSGRNKVRVASPSRLNPTRLHFIRIWCNNHQSRYIQPQLNQCKHPPNITASHTSQDPDPRLVTLQFHARQTNPRTAFLRVSS